MSLVDTGAIKFEAVCKGRAGAPAVLLIQGLGAPLTRWPPALAKKLADAGLYVILFDNRDCGLSSKMDHLGLPDFKSLLKSQPMRRPLPYTLDDMAGDAASLLDALHIESAHVVGASMGGMIAQIFAARYPARCRSLTSIMSSSGHPDLPPPTPAAWQTLLAPLPQERSEAAIVADCVARQKVLRSPLYPTSDDALKAIFTAEYRRGFYPAGVARQLAALLAQGSRRNLLSTIHAPTVVLHGEDDPLIPVACGVDTARHIPGAKLRRIAGMGHDFPEALMGEFASAILSAVHEGDSFYENTRKI